jgi:hypothetical protein
MTANIIRLEQFNVGCRHCANGVRFPHLYRVNGFEYDMVDGDLVPGTTTPVETFYTLGEEGDFGIANPTFTAIRTLIPVVDKGWIIVRHHASLARADAYIDCVGDTRPIPYEYFGPMLWQTGEGIFTLMHRPPLAGRPEHLIAYVTKVTAEGFPDIVEDAFHIVHPDGSVTTDPELMFPSDSVILGEEDATL